MYVIISNGRKRDVVDHNTRDSHTEELQGAGVECGAAMK